MKKLLVLFILLSVSVGVFAQNKVQFDTTAFISMGVYEDDSDDLSDIDMFLKSLRGGFTGSFRYEILPTVSVGIESGIGVVSYDDGTTYKIDVPVNAIARIGFDFLFLEGHTGYYFSAFEELSGSSSGLKVGLGNWFVDASAIIADEVYTRYTFGFQASNMF